MPSEPKKEIEGGEDVRAKSLNFSPTSRVTAPEVTDWHLVADHELEDISKPESGIAGAFGFAALGGAIGAMPSGCSALDKLSTQTPVAKEGLVSFSILLGSSVATIICLAIWFINRRRNSGLVTRIRARPKQVSAQSEVQ